MKNKGSARKFVLWLLIVAALAVIYYLDPNALSTLVTPATVTPAPAVLSGEATPTPSIGNPVKTTGCKSDGVLPDRGCTPGAIDPNVTAQAIDGTICITGYTSGVRPPVSVTNKIKIAQLAAYGFTGPMSDYELDHLISLELGGCADCVSNLWPEPYHVQVGTKQMGAKEKDKVENYLHRAVCNGEMTLEEAQKEIATDWTAVYYRMENSQP